MYKHDNRILIRALFLIVSIVLISSRVTAAPLHSRMGVVPAMFQATGSGLTFYVSTSGNDQTGDGSQSNPWRTIQHAANNVQAGDTVNVLSGTYNESITIPSSGSATAGPIVFQGMDSGSGPAIVDGTGLTSPSTTNGLVNIDNQSYIAIQGFTIQNYTTSNVNAAPAGIFITGGGSNIQILSNHIQLITTTAKGGNCSVGQPTTTANAFGLVIYGTSATPISNLTISGNEINGLKTGCSETVSVNGNVQNFTVSNNYIHDDNNIGIAAIGYEGVGPGGADRATNGEISGNTLANISVATNSSYGSTDYSADGIYVDGGTLITIERNLIHNVDVGIEAASENPGGETPGKEKSDYVTVRNNLVYFSNAVGITIGGYDSNSGGSDHITIVNNSLYNNGIKTQYAEGEFQIQYYATNNIFENNILYDANSNISFLYSYVSYKTSPATVDYNLYYSKNGANNGNWQWNGSGSSEDYSTFSSYQKASGNDAHSIFANPLYGQLPTLQAPTTGNFQLQAGSPAIDVGNAQLSPAPYGAVDFGGNPRIVNGKIDMGAYEHQ